MSKFADIEIDPGIIRRAARGDARAHEIIYRAFSAPVYSICLRFTKVPAHAEDLVQETFVRLVRSFGDGEARPGHLRGLVFSIAKNLVIDVYRRRGVRGHGQAEAPDPDALTGDEGPDADEAARAQLGGCVRAMLNTLPDESKDALIAHDIEGTRITDLAEAAGIGESRLRNV